MTLTELLSNEDLRRYEFPVAAHQVFLAHAAVCPLPRRVTDAVSSYVERANKGDQEEPTRPHLLSETREKAGQLLQAPATEIALVGPTSLGLSMVAGGLRWRKGDSVVVYFDDYPSNVYPWMALADRGIEVRLVSARELGHLRPVDVMMQVDESTRLVALASCHFVSGFRIDHQAIGAMLHQRGILFCLDAIQTLGAFPTPVEEIDFMAADAHKWLLGPCGAGLFYVRQAAQAALSPTAIGWNNVRCPEFVAQEHLTLRTDARRYEAGTANVLGLVGLRAALDLILEIGVEEISKELQRKRDWLVPALQAKGWTVLQAQAARTNQSGITTFYRDGVEMASVHQRLLDAQVITSLRTDRAGQRYIRLSPHFYNTDAELHRLLELI